MVENNQEIQNAVDSKIREDQPTEIGIGEHTRVAAPLSDSSGNLITPEDLKEMLGADNEPTIGVLTDISTIGMGGIGTVFSAHDPVLHREIAIKILRPAYRNKLNYVASFIREARITAQIDHPNVIPVHRLGIFDDAGTYFTMKRIRGVTLAYILRRLKEGDEELGKTYTRQRLLEIFLAICNGVAFAHSKGIIHRDLKPSNVMVGDYGEVFIADWGLALYREENDSSHQDGKIQLGTLPDESDLPASGNTSNKISGTPAFMAPEQVTNKDTDLDELIDVYALGTILYSILTWEQSPFDGVSTVSELVKRVVQRRFQRPRRRAPKRKIPYELEAITLKAMHYDKRKRYQSVIDLQGDVRNFIGKYPVSAYSPAWYRFLKMIQRRPLIPVTLLAAVLTLAVWNGSEALHLHFESRSRLTVIEDLLNDCEKSCSAAVAARKNLNEIFTTTGRTETHGDAALQRSRYQRSSNEFNVAASNAWEHLLYLIHQGVDSAKIIPLLSRLLTNQIEYATEVNNQEHLKLVINHVKSLPEPIVKQLYQVAPALQVHLQKLEHDEGELLINSNVASISLSAVKVDPVDRFGNAPDNKGVIEPAENIKLAAGRGQLLKSGLYMITAKLSNGRVLTFPGTVIRDRQEVIELNMPDKFPENMIYVPCGSFIFGDRTFDEQFARTHLPGFFIDRDEVTIGEYLIFWKSLTDPQLRERYRARVDETFMRKLKPLWDDSGNVLAPYTEKMPVIGITAEAVEAYCAYRSRISGLKYRLPTALEWEKAARGVDGRQYVWGADFMPGYACINLTPEVKRDCYPAAVCSYPMDRSIYGAMDMSGNAREIVTNPGSFPYYTVKGGSFALSRRFARLSMHAYAINFSDVGFRCVTEIKLDRDRKAVNR